LFRLSAFLRRVAIAVGAIALADPVWAHHPMGGAVPSTAWQGLLSGLGHPVIEVDHLLFLLGAAAAAALARATPARAAALLATYAVTGALGTVLRVPGAVIPLAEAAVAVSLLLIAWWLWTQRLPGTTVTALLAAGCGFFHGYAYGEAVIGAEATPLVAYLGGLVLIQTLLMMSLYFLIRRLAAAAPQRMSAAMRAMGTLIGATALWSLWA
jgi:urease accessory protein